ncbi:DHHC palmitoyltransferase-domain-containing protein [Dipodascopsis uninucleata]
MDGLNQDITDGGQPNNVQAHSLPYSQVDDSTNEGDPESGAEKGVNRSKFTTTQLRYLFPCRRDQDLSDNEWVNKKRLKYKINKVIPIILGGIICYGSYVFCYLLSWRYLVHTRHKRSCGLAFICIYAILGATIAYLCVLISIVGPGLVPKNSGSVVKPDSTGISNEKKASREAMSSAQEPGSVNTTQHSDETKVDLQPEAYLCEPDGYGLWCSRCRSVKPDRAHHSSELDRCVLKMDHYCPWVGQIIGLKNYKIFYQFVSSCVLLTVFVFVSTLVFLVDSHRFHQKVNPQYIVIIVITFVFSSFQIPFFIMHSKYIVNNITTIEFLNRKYRHYLVNLSYVDSDGNTRRMIAESDFGDQLWNIGSYKNWTQVMGTHFWEWFLPWNTNVSATRGGYSFPYNPRVMESLRAKCAESLKGMNSEHNSNTFFVARPAPAV